MPKNLNPNLPTTPRLKMNQRCTEPCRVFHTLHTNRWWHQRARCDRFGTGEMGVPPTGRCHFLFRSSLRWGVKLDYQPLHRLGCRDHRLDYQILGNLVVVRLEDLAPEDLEGLGNTSRMSPFANSACNRMTRWHWADNLDRQQYLLNRCFRNYPEQGHPKRSTYRCRGYTKVPSARIW